MDPKIKILLLDDEPADSDLVLSELELSGINYEPMVVRNREAFETALVTFRPDLILSDYALPSFDGLSAFHIKERILPDIPFIIVSGTIGEELAIQLIKTGVTDYALKDRLFVLESKIRRALREAEAKAAKRIEREKMKQQHERLLEIAFLQSHQVRRPTATILGLIGLFNFENPADPANAEVMGKLKQAAGELDLVIREIVKKTEEIKRI
jgi:DNA-binding NtrC family response regulator